MVRRATIAVLHCVASSLGCSRSLLLEPTATAADPTVARDSVVDRPSPTRLSGRVVDSRGAGVSGARVKILVTVDEGCGAWMIREAYEEAGISTVTDASGAYAIDAVPAMSDCAVEASHADFADGWRGAIAVEPGESVVAPDVSLRIGGTVEGRVTDDSTRPLAGVEVELRKPGFFPSFREPPAPNPDFLARTVTGSDGRYRFEHVGPASYDVAVRSGEAWLVRSEQQLFLRSNDSGQTWDFVVSKGESLRGSVRDANGTPIGGSAIRVSSDDAGFEAIARRVDVRSSEDGTFTVPIRWSGSYRVDAGHPGYATRYTRLQAGMNDVAIALDRLGGISGRVVDAAGIPVTAFRLVCLGAWGETITRTSDSRDFESDDGSFTFEAIDAGERVLEASAAGFAPSRSERRVVETSRTRGDVTIVLHRGGSVTGRIVDFRGSPIAGADVRVRPAGVRENPLNETLTRLSGARDADPRTRVGPDGSFRLDHLPPGAVDLSVRATGHALSRRLGVPVIDGDATDVGVVRLGAGGIARGRCIDSSGASLVGAVVSASLLDDFTGPPNSAPLFMRSAYSLSDGSYELRHLEPGVWKLTVMPRRQIDQGAHPLLIAMLAQRSEQVVCVGEADVTDTTLRFAPMGSR